MACRHIIVNPIFAGGLPTQFTGSTSLNAFFLTYNKTTHHADDRQRRRQKASGEERQQTQARVGGRWCVNRASWARRREAGGTLPHVAPPYPFFLQSPPYTSFPENGTGYMGPNGLRVVEDGAAKALVHQKPNAFASITLSHFFEKECT